MQQVTPTKKSGFQLSDKQLRWLTRAAKYSALWCASGVVWWGVLAAAGIAALGLPSLGIAIPHFLGTTSIITGTLMAAKSVVLQRLCHVWHRKCLKLEDARGVEKATANVLAKEGPENTPASIISAPRVPANASVPSVPLAPANSNDEAALGDNSLRQSFNPYAGIVLVVRQEPVVGFSSPKFKFAPYRYPGISFPRA